MAWVPTRRRRWAGSLVALSLVLGTALGAATTRSVDELAREELAVPLQQSLAQPARIADRERAGAVLWASAASLLQTWAVVAVAGLSIVGAPAVLAVIYARGFSLGFTVAFLAESLPPGTAAAAIAGLLPHNLLVLPGLMVAATAALGFSSAAARAMLDSRRPELPRHLRAYVGSLAAALLWLGAGAAAEGYVTPVVLQAVARLGG